MYKCINVVPLITTNNYSIMKLKYNNIYDLLNNMYNDIITFSFFFLFLFFFFLNFYFYLLFLNIYYVLSI